MEESFTEESIKVVYLLFWNNSNVRFSGSQSVELGRKTKNLLHFSINTSISIKIAAVWKKS